MFPPQQATSHIALVRADLWAVADSIRLSRRTLRIIKINLFWAFDYSVAGIPIAAAGLLNPLYVGGAMAFSSLFVERRLTSPRASGFRKEILG